MNRAQLLRVLFALTIPALLPAALYARESGPGNGTDYVKVAFADAHYEIARLLEPVTDRDVAALDVEPKMKRWLASPSEETPKVNANRLARLKYYLGAMELDFQDGPCPDAIGRTSSICYYFDKDRGPYVVISRVENKQTTVEQAMAMLIHEAGHFTGDPNHLFLDNLGIQLVKALAAPSVLSAEAESTDVVPNIFMAKDGCDQGSSQQAKYLRKEVTDKLLLQCSKLHIECDPARAEVAFRGVMNRRDGFGFDMTVTCTAKAVLKLR